MSSISQVSEKNRSAPRPSKELWLNDRAKAVRSRLNSAVKDMLLAGTILLDVKDEIDHGEWETWVEEQVGLPIRTAQTFMQAARLWVGLIGDDWLSHDILASHTAIYALARGDVPDEAKQKALQVMEQRVYLTESMVKGFIDGAKRAAQTEQLLEHASPEVASLARKYEVDPEIIPTLTILQNEAPETFEEIVATGTVLCGDEQVPLNKANRRDVEDSQAETRFETRMQKLGVRPNSVVQGNIEAVIMSALNAPHELSLSEKPGLAAIIFSERDSLADIDRSLGLSKSRPLLVIAATNGANYRISANGQAPEWLNEIMEKITNNA